MILFSKRRELKPGDKYNLQFFDAANNQTVRSVTIQKKMGEGTSCVCYAVKVQWDLCTTKNMILKIFYPQPHSCECCVELDDSLMVHASDPSKIRSIAEAFKSANKLQNILANQEEDTHDMIVRPVESRISDDLPCYVLYDHDYSESLKEQENRWLKGDSSIAGQKKQLLEKLHAVYQIACALQKLHQQNILHMDLRPENILWIDEHKVKFFDFDASISMDTESIRKLNNIRGTDIRLLAPELRGDRDYFQQYKFLYLNPAVDIYSLGCILFRYLFGILPEKKHTGNINAAWDWMGKQFEEKYRDVLTAEQQDLLKYITISSITENIMERYQTADIMADDLKRAIIQLQKEQKTPKRRVDYAMLAARLLDTYPLCDYPAQDASGDCMCVVIIGDSPIRSAFFEQIFACAQMPGKKLHIHFVSSDAEDFMNELLDDCPLLKSTAAFITETGMQLELDMCMTKKPLAYLYFHTGEQALEQLIVDKESAPCYYLAADSLADAQDTANHETARRLIRCFEGTERPVFIGYGDLRGDGYRLRKLHAEDFSVNIGKLKTDVFPLSASCMGQEQLQEQLYEAGVENRAFQIHCYYASDTNTQPTQEQMEQTFRDSTKNYYNKRSSVRAALSWSYKLAACGIDRNASDAVEQFETCVLSEKANRKLREQQLYLEHRSWMCFMILDGWRRPTEKQAEDYAFVNANTHQEKQQYLHPCLCDSTPEQKLRALGRNERLWQEAWYDTTKRAQYDLLDQMSLQFHVLSRKKAEQLPIDIYFTALLAEGAYAGESLEFPVEKLQQATNEIRCGVLDGNVHWSNAVKAIREQTNAENVKLLIDVLERNMRPWIEWNSYRDYKFSDESILMALTEKSR